MVILAEVVFWLCCLAIAIYDVCKMQIHRVFLCILIILSMVKIVMEWYGNDLALNRIFIQIGMACALGGVLFLITMITNGQLGMGDIKLLVVLSIYKGYLYILLSLFHAFILCGIIAAIGLLLRKINKTTRLPFAPFLTVGMIITTMLYEQEGMQL